jgi:uncharacterized membrane protein
MGWHDMGGWSWAWMTVVMVAIWASVVLLAGALLRHGSEPSRATPEDTLRLRLARGDIGVDEYQRRADALPHGDRPV